MGSGWSGEFVFGAAWAAYRGPVDSNSLHAHVAIQIVVAHESEASVSDAEGRVHRGRSLFIRPMVPHALAAEGTLSLLYVEPQSPLAAALLESSAPNDISRFSSELAGRLDPSRSPAEWIDALAASLPSEGDHLDPRLAQATAALSDNPGALAVAAAAAAAGLSPSRLRALARRQLGLPLVTWLLWRKLERAAQALAAGATAVEAAGEGGFADQAHLARAMRRMFGVTPGMAVRALL